MSQQPYTALVVGGCGFVGFHIVRHLLNEDNCASVHVASRNPLNNRLPNVDYHAVDISNADSLGNIISTIQPTVIIHAACPSAVAASTKEMEIVTVQGTGNLLAAAKAYDSVKAFIFTSSSTMAAGAEHIDLSEDAPLADEDLSSHAYARTKAQADKAVLRANGSIKKNGDSLRTGCLRLPIVYGERDYLAVGGVLAALEKGRTNVQLGDGSNLWDFASAENVAVAHALLVKALLYPGPLSHNVDGEAFHISDGERHPFWDFPRLIWKAAGHEIDPRRVWKIPTRVALMMASIAELLFFIFTAGTKRPNNMSKQQVEYSCFTHTYSIQKARERLGYLPTQNFEGGIREQTLWALNGDGWAARLSKEAKTVTKQI